MKYAVFTLSGEGLPIAYKLQEEGSEVLVGMIDDVADIATKDEKIEPENPEEKKRRLLLWKGKLNIKGAKELANELRKVDNPSEWFLFFDFNHCFKYAEMLSDMDFNGNFPTEQDRAFEVNREMANEFVKKHYGNLKSGESHDFKSVKDAQEFLKDTDYIWVLKGYDEDARTVVPDSKDPELAASQLLEVLEAEGKKYEKSGFVLEKKIIDPIELTPQKVYYNGEPIYTNLDIELKKFGAGDTGVMTGCAADLVFQTDMESEINKLAFPEIVDQLAKKHKGLFVWDASLLIDPMDLEIYFGEFCPNRVGYNAFYNELAQCDSVSDYFEKIVEGKNPFKPFVYGASVRFFNLHKDSEERRVLADSKVEYKPEIEDDLWLMDVMEDPDEKGELVTVGYSWDLGVITSTGKRVEEAFENLFRKMGELSFEGIYYRPLHDILSHEYAGAILNRLNHAIYSGLLDEPKVGEDEVDEIEPVVHKAEAK